MATRKSPRSRARRAPAEGEIDAPPAAPAQSERELVVMVNQEAAPMGARGGFKSASEADLAPLADLLASENITLQPLFGLNQERMAARAATRGAPAPAEETGVEPPNLSVFYRVEAPDARLEDIAERLREHDAVQAAFIKPPNDIPFINDMAPSPEVAPPVTGDFTARQIYLNAAPAGIDARFAWTINGGTGAGIRIIDIEGAWRFSHEDLLQNQGGVVGGTQSTDIVWRNHGTAVVGEFGGDRNTFGITGICPDANVRAISVFGGLGSARAIRQAADMLSAGDIILIELHRAGPRFNFQNRPDQRGFIAIEWWPDDMAAIQYAVSRGVIVVEAAGNGAENLDDPLYDRNPPAPWGPFPGTWRNPFRRNPIDTGSIVVGAGAPPPGTHGRDYGADRSRLDFSNYGSIIDAQGWGAEVTTTGYGDLQGGANEDLWYTDTFGGTSSASPIIVGALGCAQGTRRASGQQLLTPASARNLLRTTGSPQQDGPNGTVAQRIGNRPNLRQMISGSPTPVGNTVPLYRYWNAGAGDHFYTTNWAELGGGTYGYVYEGFQCHVLPQQRANTVPLYRYVNNSVGNHFYTTNWSELGAGRYGYVYEGIQCFVYIQQMSNMVPLYRYWNANATDHLYTTNWAELGGGRYGYVYEGVQCFVFAQPTSAPSAPSAEGTSSTGEGQSEPKPTPEAGMHSAGSETSSPIPATFRMGAPSGGMESGGLSSSFAASGDEAGVGVQSGLISGKDSFTFRSSAASGMQTQEGKGEVTINIHLGSGKGGKS